MKKKLLVSLCVLVMIVSSLSTALALSVDYPSASITTSVFTVKSDQEEACRHEVNALAYEVNTTTLVQSSKDAYGSASSQKSYKFTMYSSSGCVFVRGDASYTLTFTGYNPVTYNVGASVS